MAIGDSDIFKRAAGDERPTAVVVAVQLPGVTDGELASSIAELERLAKTLGLDPVGRVVQRRARLAPGVVLGEGKLRELATWTGGSGDVPVFESVVARRRRIEAEADAEADAEGDEPEGPDEVDPDDAPAADAKPTRKAEVVIVDHDLTPTQ